MKVNFTGEEKPRRAGPLSGTTSLTIVALTSTADAFFVSFPGVIFLIRTMTEWADDIERRSSRDPMVGLDKKIIVKLQFKARKIQV